MRAMNTQLSQFLTQLTQIPVTCLMTLCTLVIAVVPGLQPLLQFDSVAIASGEVWRFVTGHLTHWNAEHCFWDLAVFAVLGFICERRDRRAFAGCVGGSIVLISMYQLFLQADLQTYRGLSGIDSGLFALLAVFLIRDSIQTGDKTMITLILTALLAFGAKNGWEFTTGATVFVKSAGAFIPVPMAHFLGAVAGFAAGLRDKFTRENLGRWFGRSDRGGLQKIGVQRGRTGS